MSTDRRRLRGCLRAHWIRETTKKLLVCTQAACGRRFMDMQANDDGRRDWRTLYGDFNLAGHSTEPVGTVRGADS